MEKEQFNKFINSLLEGKDDITRKNPEQFSAGDVMADKVIEQFSKESNLVDEDKIAELRDQYSLAEIVKILQDSGVDIQSTLNGFFDTFNKIKTVDVQGKQIDTREFARKWEYIQRQFVESEKFDNDLI
jgi:hypothetical protein